LIPALGWEPAVREHHHHGPAVLMGALGSVRTNLRCATASSALAEVGGTPDGTGGHTTGGTVGARSESRGWHATGRSDERTRWWHMRGDG
jgi:hypothetical protein